ncbi:spherulation-specific family 4 protein [Streptomyces sp. V3I7]|uniref:spherulation-specific family 4 protein n=1 Tax=Streptomyces sp. V3I7 TaxID=3042278 RepID=UPI0027883215|nr:spherulation-specific family 4 protein [Streptomyces sp. V3I7]MDQ0990467.1 hypothetical protein [Streptomyces sp. V3I7]
MSALLVPYYEHPSVRPAEWESIALAAPRLYGVVLNPASGPGERPDPAFAEAAARLRAAGGAPSGGVRLLGYVDTDYGRRPHADVVRDLARYRSWYGTDGAFLDQAAAGVEQLRHYQHLAAAAWSTGCGTLVLNHGTPPHPAYARLADVLVTFEGPWSAYRTARPPPGRYDPGVRLCHLVYGVPPGVDLESIARERGAGVHCAVPGTGPHPWGTLPYGVRVA